MPSAWPFAAAAPDRPSWSCWADGASPSREPARAASGAENWHCPPSPGPHEPTRRTRALIQRSQEHKPRNVVEHRPDELHTSVGRALRDPWDGANAALAAKQLQRLAASLQDKHPDAAASMRERLDETLTGQRLGITEALYRTLRTTNSIESLNGSIAPSRATSSAGRTAP